MYVRIGRDLQTRKSHYLYQIATHTHPIVIHSLTLQHFGIKEKSDIYIYREKRVFPSKTPKH